MEWPPKRESLNRWDPDDKPIRDYATEVQTFSQWYESPQGQQFIRLYGKDTAMKIGEKILNNAKDE